MLLLTLAALYLSLPQGTHTETDVAATGELLTGARKVSAVLGSSAH